MTRYACKYLQEPPQFSMHDNHVHVPLQAFLHVSQVSSIVDHTTVLSLQLYVYQVLGVLTQIIGNSLSIECIPPRLL